VITNLYSAEYGRAEGGVVSVYLKSCTNAFHGSLFEYWRNDILQARSYFNVPPQVKPRFFQHQFGGSLGGPIKKNKLFFFFDYSGLRNKTPSTSVVTVPTAKMRQGDFTELPRQIFDPTTTLQVAPYSRQPLLQNYGERRREGKPISTGWVESAINEIIAKRSQLFPERGRVILICDPEAASTFA
jgi:hypothetical protein